MELTNEFRVPVPVGDAWALLTDVERIAPCLPGAELTEVDGDVYRGAVKVKVGPIVARYTGEARFVERDDAAHRAVLRAEGREARGQGNAAATVTARLRPAGDATDVTVVTELVVTGKVAQFGRGVLADVSTKLLGQFATRLESELLATNGDDGSSAGEARPEARPVTPPPTEPVDLLEAAGAPLVRRILPAAALAAVLWLVARTFRRCRRRF